MSHPTKILFVTAIPSDKAPLQLDEEIRLIGQHIRRGEYRKMFSVQSAPALRATDLPYELMEQAPDIVHFSGHGSAAGELLFLRDDDQAAQPIPVGTLARVFRQLGGRVKCVVLNACYSETQAAAIAESVPCVVGMSRAVSDRTAIAFAAGFYEALAFGKSVAEAFELGQLQVELAHPLLADTAQIPNLQVRAGVDAKQVFLVSAPTPSLEVAKLSRVQGTNPPPSASRIQRIGNLTVGGQGNRVQLGQHATATHADSAAQEVADIQLSGEENQIVVEQKDS